jgi:hypothetical protein
MRYALAAGAMLLVAPGPLLAATPAELKKRVQELEAALAAVKADLEAAKTTAADAGDRLVRIEKKAAEPPPAPPPTPEGFKVGDATVKINGFAKAEALVSDYGDGDTATNALGRDFYLPSSIPVGAAAAAEDLDLDAHAKQTRIWLTISRGEGASKLGAHVEGDFQSAAGTQGSERTTNAYNFAMRRVFVTYGKWLFGQEWTTFMSTATLPDVVDFIGPTEGTVFVRQPMIRYTRALGDKAALVLALENPETAYATPASTGLSEPDDDSLPDLVARVNLKPAFGELMVAGLVRQLSVDIGPRSEETTGFGVSVAGKITLGKSDDLRFAVTSGEGIGRYVGLNFAPDAVLTASDLDPVSVLAGYAALRHVWSPKLRSSFVLSVQDVDRGLQAAAGNEQAWSGSVNLFYTPVKGLDLGAEYRHAERELFTGASGTLDRLHLVAKHTF